MIFPEIFMKYVFIIIALLISACDLNTYNYEIEGFQKACADKGGLAKISNVVGSVGLCANGETVKWESQQTIGR